MHVYQCSDSTLAQIVLKSTNKNTELGKLASCTKQKN